MVQWLRLCTSNAGGTVSIPGWENKIRMLHGVAGKKKERERERERERETLTKLLLDR